MSSFRDKLRAAEPEAELLAGKITGAAAAVPTITEGMNGVTIARAGVGLLDFTFQGPVKQCFAADPGKWADTITNIDGWDVIWGQYNATTKTIRGTVVNEAQTISDLPAATGLNLIFFVKNSTAVG
jgi:hypothetical protein